MQLFQIQERLAVHRGLGSVQKLCLARHRDYRMATVDAQSFPPHRHILSFFEPFRFHLELAGLVAELLEELCAPFTLFAAALNE